MGDFGNLSNLRFALLAIGLFAAAFVGISWASKGFPVMAMRAAPMKPDARLPTFEQSVQQGQRKDWEQSKTSQGDNDPGRNQMRQTAIQAAFDAGGVTKSDFPTGTQLWVASIAQSDGDSASPCAVGRQAEKMR